MTPSNDSILSRPLAAYCSVAVALLLTSSSLLAQSPTRSNSDKAPNAETADSRNAVRSPDGASATYNLVDGLAMTVTQSMRPMTALPRLRWPLLTRPLRPNAMKIARSPAVRAMPPQTKPTIRSATIPAPLRPRPATAKEAALRIGKLTTA